LPEFSVAETYKLAFFFYWSARGSDGKMNCQNIVSINKQTLVKFVRQKKSSECDKRAVRLKKEHDLRLEFLEFSDLALVHR
jgi:hypothetical protein